MSLYPSKNTLKALSPTGFVAASPVEKKATPFVAAAPVEMYSPAFYSTCAIGGALACGLTHTFVTPLDLVKCRRQVRAGRWWQCCGGANKQIRASPMSLVRGHSDDVVAAFALSRSLQY